MLRMFAERLTHPPILPSQTAILIFAQPAVSDAGCKRFGGQPSGNRRVLDQLNQRVRQTAEDTKLPVLHSAELISHTGTFGEQLTGALQAAFTLGFEHVLVIGNDCPALSARNLIRAADQLKSTPVVLGPNRRGGVYLFGLSRDAFDSTSLTSLPWQTDQLSRSIVQLYSAGPIAMLPQLGDVNNRIDLRHYHSTSQTVASFITRLLTLGANKQIGAFGTRPARPVNTYVGGIDSLRAPPAPCATAIAA